MPAEGSSHCQFLVFVFPFPWEGEENRLDGKPQRGTVKDNDWNYFGEQEPGWGFTMGNQGRAGETFAPGK